jgi:hypothetical protein
MAFSTWAACYASMLDELAAGNTRVGSVTVGGKQINYRNHESFMALLDYAERKANQESGAAVNRVYAKQGGRG